MEPIIYSSQDADAPQLSLTAGALNTVLKGCLVTGYGDKPAAGWEIAHEDMAAHKLAIRSTSPKSIKSVLLLDDTATGYAAVTAYNDWDDALNKGIDKYADGFYRKAWNGNYSANWTVLATNSFFYLQVLLQGESYGVVTAFGDAITFDNTQDFSVLMSSSATTGYSSDQTGHKGVAVNTHATALFPLSPYAAFTEYWGDRSPSSMGSSNIAMFTRCVLSVMRNNKQTPSLALPGMLLPYASVLYSRVDSNIRLLDVPFFSRPLVSLYQPWHGSAWVQVDDWG